MIHAVSWREARTKALRAESPAAGSPVDRYEYFGPDGYLEANNAVKRMALYEALLVRPEAPHAYIVDQHAGSEIASHFHRVPQYQITVAGSGRMGRHPLALGVIHYADEYTAYGPIVAGAEGLSYCVLRPMYDPGGMYLNKPGARDELRPSAQRYLVAGGMSAAQTGGGEAIALDRDGLGAWIVHLDAGETAVTPNPVDGGGQYLVVLSGMLEYEGVTYDPKSVLWVSASDQALTLKAGAEGAAYAVMQFPRDFSSRRRARN